MKLFDVNLARAFVIPLGLYTHEVPGSELVLGACFATSVDVWSIGCIFAEIPMLRALFSSDSEICQLFRIFRTISRRPTKQLNPLNRRQAPARLPTNFPALEATVAAGRHRHGLGCRRGRHDAEDALG